MSAHTPGPWKLAEDGTPFVYQLGQGGTNRFCLMVQGGGSNNDAADFDERVAIARLIAAAPELLDALTAIQPYMDGIICYASTMGEHEPNRIAVQVDAAIAKAEGKS